MQKLFLYALEKTFDLSKFLKKHNFKKTGNSLGNVATASALALVFVQNKVFINHK